MEITFELRPHRNEDWRMLTLLVDGEVKVDREINLYYWDRASEKTKEHAMFDLVTKDLEKDLLRNKANFVDPSFYQKWYEYEYFIDGEDAREFIEMVPRTRHFGIVQEMLAVTYGWRYYKRLRSHDFNERTAANLAYWRGYLAGMDLNAPWDAEGLEALRCMDLDLEEGKKHCFD